MTGAEVALAAAVAPEVIAGVSSATAAGLGAVGTAAGLGAAGTAAGTAAGLGGGMASLFGPAAIGAAEVSPLAATMAAPMAAAAPMAVAPPAIGMGGGGLSTLFGMEAAGGMGAPGMGVASSGLPWAKMAGQMGKGLLADEQQPTPHAQRPANNSQPMDSAQIMERLRRAQSQRSNWAGLLGGAGR